MPEAGQASSLVGAVGDSSGPGWLEGRVAAAGQCAAQGGRLWSLQAVLMMHTKWTKPQVGRCSHKAAA